MLPSATAPRQPTPSMSSASAKMPSRKPSAGPIVALLFAGATFIGGYVLGTSMGQKAGYNQGATETTSALKAKLQTSGIIPPQVETHQLTGKVTAVRADGFDIEVSPMAQNPFAASAPAKRAITVSATTKFSALVQRSPAEMDAAQKDFFAAMQKVTGKAGEVPPAPPTPFTTKEAKLSDLSDGVTVTVTSAAEISKAASFAASDVSIQPTPSGAAVLPTPGTPPSGTPAPAPVPAPAPTPAPTK